MKTYLAYVEGGKCKDTHAPTRDDDGNIIKQPQTHKQFWVRDELMAMGIDAWCGDRIDFKRTGKSRDTTPVRSPALPNYLFMDLTPEQFAKALTVEHIGPTFRLLSNEDLHGHPKTEARTKEVDGYDVRAKPAKVGLLAFKEAAEADLRDAQRVEANKRASVAEYVAGQRLRILSGPFMDMFANFDKMVQAAHDPWPRVSVEIDGRYTVALDPLDVRSA